MKTSVKFGVINKPVSQKPNYSTSPTQEQLPPVQGLQLGKVTKLSGDPEKGYRIEIEQLTGKDGTSAKIWARYANFYATKTAGLGFLPEIDDEVVVGYIESDPRFPIILGSLYSKTNAPAAPAADENNYIKSLTTKEKLTLSFDDQKKIITIKTPGANTITISDEDKAIEIKDQNNNVVKLSSSGIDLTSKKDINITATGNITIDATQKLTLAAKQDLTGTGLNVSLKADMGMTAKGTATAEFSASGQTTVKGGVVMIN